MSWTTLKLEKIISSKNDKSKQVNSSEYLTNGTFPIIDQSDNFIAGFCEDERKVVKNNLPLTVFGDHTRHVKFINFPFVCGADGTQLMIPIGDIDDKYFYFLICNASVMIGNYGYDRHFKHLKEFITAFTDEKSEQTHIAKILSKADAAIEQTEKLIAKYQRIKTGLMQDLLTKGIDEHGNIRNEKTHRFKTENGLRVPVDWSATTLGEITEHVGSGVTPKGGSNVYGHEGVMLIRSQNVLIGEFNFEDVAFISTFINDTMQRSELQELDVLLNITGASIGRSHFIPMQFPKANVNQHVCALRIKNKSIGKSLFVSSFLNSSEGQRQIKKLLGASNREGLNYQQIREIKIPFPDLSDDTEFQEIFSVLSAINSKIEILKNNYKKHTSLKTGLMQDLLSGTVRVKIKEEARL